MELDNACYFPTGIKVISADDVAVSCAQSRDGRGQERLGVAAFVCYVLCIPVHGKELLVYT